MTNFSLKFSLRRVYTGATRSKATFFFNKERNGLTLVKIQAYISVNSIKNRMCSMKYIFELTEDRFAYYPEIISLFLLNQIPTLVQG